MPVRSGPRRRGAGGLSEAWARQPDATVIHDLLERLIPPPRPEDRPRSLDGRIQRVIRLMKDDLASGYSMNELAEHVNLSPTRLLHLFRRKSACRSAAFGSGTGCGWWRR